MSRAVSTSSILAVRINVTTTPKGNLDIFILWDGIQNHAMELKQTLNTKQTKIIENMNENYHTYKHI